MIFSKYKKTLPKNHDKTKVYQKFVDEYLPNIEKTRAPNRERSLASKVEEDKARTIRQSGLRKEALAFATTDRMKGFSGGFNAWLAKLTETDDTAFWDDMGREKRPLSTASGAGSNLKISFLQQKEKAPPVDYVCEVRCDDGKEPAPYRRRRKERHEQGEQA